MTGGAAVRCFIALEIPADIREYLATVARRLRTAGVTAAWVGPDNIHLTLKFLGERPEQQVDAVKAQLDGLRGTLPRIRASLGPLGVFPGRQRPQVVWAGLVTPDNIAGRLQQEIERRTQAAGFARETRAFSPHLTLGRLRPDDDPGASVGMILREPVEPREFTIDSLALMQSDLTPRGAVHRKLLTIGLE